MGYVDSDPVGNVIARMMKVADVLGMSASSISHMSGDEGGAVEAGIVDKYFKDIPLSAPVAMAVERSDVRLDKPGATVANENSEYYLLDDPKVHGKVSVQCVAKRRVEML